MVRTWLRGSLLSGVGVFLYLALNDVRGSFASKTDDTYRPNVVMLMFDDLRCELSVYGRDVITPNIEKLAARSVVFDRAYNQAAVCSPSRASILSGLRPDTLAHYGFEKHDTEGRMQMPRWFYMKGYSVSMIGKVAHFPGSHDGAHGPYEWDKDWYGYQNMEHGLMNASVQPDSVHEEKWFRDYEMTTIAIERLEIMTKLQSTYERQA